MLIEITHNIRSRGGGDVGQLLTIKFAAILVFLYFNTFLLAVFERFNILFLNNDLLFPPFPPAIENSSEDFCPLCSPFGQQTFNATVLLFLVVFFALLSYSAAAEFRTQIEEYS